ncbi:hypothetical protein [Sinorhizobium chiapasense]|uniref:Uncharacterized protein n=1 Tax=Sinorhizobium chiapasense TaxID=501572 RepID=A0ABZ2BBA2_9HYPH
MVALKISAFAGERPLILPRLLPDTSAKAAQDVRLNDGGLTPINKPTAAGTISNATHTTIYRHLGTWLSWAGTVNAVPGAVAQDRLYFTGDGVPKVRVSSTNYNLKVSRPTGALTATLSGSGSGDTQSRTYVYTWVTSFGEESAPAPASNIVNWKPGQTVTLSGFAATPSGRSITQQRIYRSQTGRSGTYLYLIAERTASTSDFTDNIAVDQFQEALPSADWTEPPDTLAGLVSMPNGMMAAFVGRDVYFCEPWRPHAWPEKYIMSVDSDVVGLASLGGILVVMTKAQPYLMSGSHPDSMQSQKLEANLPCINARSIADLGHAVCYASNDGLVAVRGDGSINLVTEQMMSRKDWLALSPSTIVGGQINGIYMLFYDNIDSNGDRLAGALFIYVNGQPFLVRTSAIASAVYFDVADTGLYFKAPSSAAVQRFDPPIGAPHTLYWRSKEFITTRPTSMGAILVDRGRDIVLEELEALQAERDAIIAANAAIFATGDLGGDINAKYLNQYEFAGDALEPVPPEPTAADATSITIGIYADGKLIQTLSTTDRIVRIKAGLKARQWEVDVSTNTQIAQIVMAGSVEELKQVV